MADLKVSWCSYEAAKYAVMHWHYSKRLPTSKQNFIGVWEGGEYVGVVMYGNGSTRNLVRPYDLEPEQGCELRRIAFREHKYPLSQIVSHSLRLIKRKNPGLRLVVSFADPEEGHSGIIYQAGNWIYSGMTSPSFVYMDERGKEWHARNVGMDLSKNAIMIRPTECTRIKKTGKHRYLYPLDKSIRRKIANLAQPYPKNAGEPSKVEGKVTDLDGQVRSLPPAQGLIDG